MKPLVEFFLNFIGYVGLRVLQAFISVYLVVRLVPQVHGADSETIWRAAITMAELVVIVRPALMMTLLTGYLGTAGIMAIPVNGALYLLVEHFVPGFHVADYWAAAKAGALQSVLSGVTLAITFSPKVSMSKVAATIARPLDRWVAWVDFRSRRYRRGAMPKKDR